MGPRRRTPMQSLRGIPRPARLGIDYIRTVFGFERSLEDATTDLDAVIVALDFEILHAPHTIAQFGAAYLDTRDLQSREDDTGTNPLEIKTRQICATKGQRYFSRCARRFHFGEAESWVTTSDTEILHSLLRIRDDRSQSPDELRKIILVGYGVIAELNAMAKCNVELATIAPVIAIVDVMYVARSVIEMSTPYSLANVLRVLGLSRKNLHTAGNDANFTLRAMLLLVTIDQGHELANVGLTVADLRYSKHKRLKEARKRTRRNERDHDG